jgi:hypothetical protein
MDTDLQRSQPSAATEAVPTALLFELSDDDPQAARIASAQQLLFPSAPRAMCEEVV